MRKLDKKITLSIKYKDWYEENQTHTYDSTSNKFYYDVLYELLIIQQGLCAYTELRLIDHENLEKLKVGFVAGKYTANYKPDVPAQIEHFSKDRKATNGWDWNNLFAAFMGVNLKKNHLENKYGIDNILKPDTLKYDPHKYLLYDASLHIFIPNSKLSKTEYEKVFNMILVLGLNNDWIKMKRKGYLEAIKEKESWLQKKQTINQFYTAYDMMQAV